MEIEVQRIQRYSQSIGGKLSVDGRFACYTLELPWRWNAKDVSCIPGGNYHCFWRFDRGRIELQNIRCPGGIRTNVQIHTGNRPNQIKGCILVGMVVSPNTAHRSREAANKLERALFGNQHGPGYDAKTMTLTVSGVLMDSRFDEFDFAAAV